MSVHRLINKVKQSDTTQRKTESSRMRTPAPEKNKQNVEKMIAFQEKCLGRHKSLRQIAAQLQVSRRSVQRMTKDLGYRYSKGSGFHNGMQTFEQNEKLDIGTSMTDIQMRKK